MQSQIQSLVWEDSTCHRAPQPVLRNERNHRNEKPPHLNEEQLPLPATRESSNAVTKT